MRTAVENVPSLNTISSSCVRFASRLADDVDIMEKGSIVLQGKLDVLSDAAVKRYLTC
jgi:ABC-type branched-subunit amino acid transport system ATPase component